MTPQQRTDDIAAGDAAPIATGGRHVAAGTTALSIFSFVGGRFPRHRADVEEEFSDFFELVEFPEFADGR